MESGNVVQFPEAASRSRALEYTVLFQIQGADVGFKVFGVADTTQDRQAIATAFEEAAKVLREYS